MTIEERMAQAWGMTSSPECCVWILQNGAMVSGSYEGFQRDRDHREVSQFYSRSKFQEPGSSSIYIKKFMLRGNIRCGCSRYGYAVQVATTPTRAQLRTLEFISRIADTNGIDFMVSKRDRRDFWSAAKWYGYEDYLLHLVRYGCYGESILYAA